MYTQTSVPTKKNAHPDQSSLLSINFAREKFLHGSKGGKKDKRLWVGGAGGRVVMSETTKQRNGTHTQRTGHKKNATNVCRLWVIRLSSRQLRFRLFFDDTNCVPSALNYYLFI